MDNYEVTHYKGDKVPWKVHDCTEGNNCSFCRREKRNYAAARKIPRLDQTALEHGSVMPEQKPQWRPARGEEWEKWRYKKSLMLARKFADAVGQTDEEKICLMAAQIAEDLAA